MTELLTGAAADVRELEYITAIHQSEKVFRKECSIKADDIRNFLCSRYGIVVTEQEVRETIFNGLGGGSDESEVLDLLEVVALLFIPTILKAARAEAKEVLPYQTDDDDNGGDDVTEREMIPPPEGLLQFLLNVILHDATGTSASKPLTAGLLKHIFLVYGEKELAEDEVLLEEMIRVATSESIVDTDDDDTKKLKEEASVYEKPHLTLETFARGLTYDVQLYDVKNEIRSTTNFQDVFQDEIAGFIDKKKKNRMKQQLKEGFKDEVPLDSEGGERAAVMHLDLQDLKNLSSVAKEVNRKYTAPAIDNTAGTVRSKTLAVSIMVFNIVFYFCYTYAAGYQAISFCGSSFNSVDPWGDDNIAQMVCEIFSKIVEWFLQFIGLIIQGLLAISLMSSGNFIGAALWRPLFGAFICLCAAWIPWTQRSWGPDKSPVTYDDDYWATLDDDVLKTPTEDQEPQIGRFVMAIFVLIIGNMCAAIHLNHFLSDLIPRCGCFRNVLYCKRWFARGAHGEANVKYSCSFKLARMAQNSLELLLDDDKEGVLNTYYARGLDSFADKGKRFEQAGGYIHGWKNILNQKYFKEEGMWVSTRLMSSNIAQCIVVLYMILTGNELVKRTSKAYDIGSQKETWKEFLQDFMTSSFSSAAAAGGEQVGGMITGVVTKVLNQTGIDLGCDNVTTSGLTIADRYCGYDNTGNFTCDMNEDVNWFCALEDGSLSSLDVQSAVLDATGLPYNDWLNQFVTFINDNAESQIENLFPQEKYMVMAPVVIAVVMAVVTGLYLSLTYMPSVAFTILKLRTGMIPTYRDPHFQIYRQAPDLIVLLTGSIFWGSFIASLVVGGLVGFVVFLLLWQATVQYVQKLIAIVIGVTTTIVIRLLIVQCVRCYAYQGGFYRSKPAFVNFLFLALEWAAFAVSVMFVVVRMAKLLVVSAAYIGRIDTPIFAKGVGQIGNFQVDNFPTIHTMDILAMEAHRHPYIELLGVMYMMKLRYADHFGKSAGSCWRLLFVYALFPWMNSYRIRGESDEGKGKRGVEKSLPLSMKFASIRKLEIGPENDDGDKAAAKREEKELLKSVNEDTVETSEQGADEEMKLLKAENKRLNEMNQRLTETIRQLSPAPVDD